MMETTLRTLTLEHLLCETEKRFDEEALAISNFLIMGESYSSLVFGHPIYFHSIEDRPSQLKGKVGVYVFLLTNDQHFDKKSINNWNDCKGAKFKDFFNGELYAGDVLYVGSCYYESLYVRTRKHFLANKEVASLNLGLPEREMLKDSVRVYAFPLETKFSESARIIVTSIEKRLHRLLDVKTGSSRA